MASRPGIMLAHQELEETARVVAALLDGLDAGTARKALAEAVGSGGRMRAARLWSLRRFLSARPEALQSGQFVTRADTPRLVAPRDVKRLIVALAGLGQPGVVIPVKLCPSGHEVPDNWAPSVRCGECDLSDGLDAAAGALTGCLDGLDGEQARAAVLTAIEGGKTRHRIARAQDIAYYLCGHPQVFTAGDPAAPMDILRLIGALREAGFTGIAEPRCADCGRAGFLRGFRADGKRICVSCSANQPSRFTACARCGNERRVSARDSNGGAVCDPCHRADPSTWRRCDRCGNSASIRATVMGQRLCEPCYPHPHERCSVCGLGRGVSVYKTGKATCAACAGEPLAACSACGLDASVSRDGNEPLCIRCASGDNKPCSGCRALTVSRALDGTPRCLGCYERPRRRCGRCGRVRVIVRLATGTDPELCGSCWLGPVTRCEKCGRHRPCRGERSGQMLCGGCRPHPKRACAYCGNRRVVSVMWREGPACAQCYRKAMRAKAGCPGCGQYRRLLPYPGTSQDLCAGCAGAPPGPVCGACGNEDWLYRKQRCARCVLKAELGDMLGDQDNRTRRGLQPLFESLTAAERPEAVIGWLRKRPRRKILTQLANGELELSHAALETVDDVHRNVTSYLDALLTALGTLPERDIHLDHLQRDLAKATKPISDPRQQQLLRAYTTWGLLRHARAKAAQAPLTSGVRHTQYSHLKTAIHFTDWLAGRCLTLATCRQPDLEDYLLAFPTRIAGLRNFLSWARRHRDPELTLPPGTGPRLTIPLGQEQRWALARKLLHDDGYTLPDRVAGLLVLLFGQRSGQINRLTTDAIGTSETGTTLSLGVTPVDIPEPLAAHLTGLAGQRRHLCQIPASGPGPWLFPGLHAGRPLLPATISHRLARIGIDTTTARAGALLHLGGELPPTVMADLLGLRPKTAIAWSQLSGRLWSQYAAERSQRQ